MSIELFSTISTFIYLWDEILSKSVAVDGKSWKIEEL
jgi:hypothetical protein